MKGIAIFTAVFMVFANSALVTLAQDEPIPSDEPVPSPEPGAPIFSSEELSQMLEPIALYPDPLIAQILPAATQPSQIAIAANYVNQGGDPNLIDQQPWDSSVRAVAHYPDVLNLLNGNIPWTSQLGQAFINQPDDVMNAIQSLRAQAQDLGNLESTPEDQVLVDNGIIEILPVDPDMLYVPIYDPGIIFFQRPYGRHFITWGRGYRNGGWLDHDFDWRDHHVIVWDRDHPRPNNWWREKPSQRPRQVVSRAPVWHPPQSHVVKAPVQSGDRGYPRPAQNRTVVSRTPEPRAPQGRQNKVQVTTIPSRPTVVERAPAQHQAPPAQHVTKQPAPAQQRSSSLGAFNGSQSARDTRAASNRGQESRQTISRPASPPPASHSSPPSGGGGGGGGGGGRKH